MAVADLAVVYGGSIPPGQTITNASRVPMLVISPTTWSWYQPRKERNESAQYVYWSGKGVSEFCWAGGGENQAAP